MALAASVAAESRHSVLFSLFVCGLKLRLPLRDKRWRIAFGLAGPVMVLTIAGVSVLLHWGLQLSWGPSLLIGAMLAPTDPVLAALVQVNDARDVDSVRFGLSGEAGLNDGVAFPFVILGLLLIHGDGSAAEWQGWVLRSLLWAVPAGLLTGYWMGRGIGRVTLSPRGAALAASGGIDALHRADFISRARASSSVGRCTRSGRRRQLGKATL